MKIELPVKAAPISMWKRKEMQWADLHPFRSAKPYSDGELSAAFKEWGTPEAGQIYIRQSRKLAPTRADSARVGNMISHYTSKKMGTRLVTASKGVEFRAVVKADFDGYTHEIYCQPKQVKIPTVVKFTSSRGKVIEYQPELPCTPDLLQLSDYGPFVDESKTEQQLQALAKKNPHRFFKSEDGTWHCPEREAFFKELGITYRVRSSEEHADLFASNLENLSAYLIDEARSVSEDAWSAIDKIVRGAGGRISMAALNRQAYNDETPLNQNIAWPTPAGRFSVDDVWKAIADQLLFVDLYYDDLTDPHTVVLCSSREQLEDVIWRRPAPHAVDDYFILTADIGTEFVFRGNSEVFNISAMAEGKVFYRDSRSEVCEELREDKFKRMMFDGDVQLLSPKKSAEQLLAENPPIDDGRIQRAHLRFELLKQLEQMDIPLPCCVRTLQRWRKKIREVGESGPRQVKALIPGKPGGRGQQIGDDVLGLIKEVALGANNPTNPSAANSFNDFVKLCKDARVKPCCRNTFYARAAEFRNVRAREGDRRAYNVAPAVWYLKRTDKVHGGRPFQRVHIDHTKLDIIIKIQGYGGRMYRLRPWLTVVMDEESRAVLGFYLTYHAPSKVSCMMALRAMVSIHKRVPDVIVCDNGKEFHSRVFDNFCHLNDITIDYRPAHQSRFGSVIERLFGTTNDLEIHKLVGNTKATQHVRTLTRSVDPINADHLDFVQLHGILEHFFFTIYNRERRHPAHDQTPEQYMYQRFIETGKRLTRLRAYDTQFMLQTLIPANEKKDGYQIKPSMGVKVGGVWYWTDEFAGTRNKKKKAPVFLDMWDVSVAYVIIRGRWYRCVSNLLLRYRNLTSIELRYAFYQVRLKLKAAPEENFESVLDGVIAEYNVPPAVAAAAATRMIYGPAGLTTVASSISTKEDTIVSVDPDVEHLGESETRDEAKPRRSEQPHPGHQPRPSKYNVDYSSLAVQNPVR
jgi:putative transposase